MNPVLEYEKKLYFCDKKVYLISCITHEDNYRAQHWLEFLRRF